MKKLFNYALCMLACIMVQNNLAKMIEFTENPYEMQAPEEITTIVEKTVQDYGFDKDYEVLVPKKAGIDLNPWLQYGMSLINPLTKNYLIAVNQEWFLSLPENQQRHFLFYNFIQHEQGAQPFINKLIPWIHSICFFVFFFLLYILLSKIEFFAYSKIRRGLSTFLICWIVFVFGVNPLETKFMQYLTVQHFMKLHGLAAQKTGNKEAAIDYLTSIDASMRQRAENGDEFYLKVVPTLKTQEFIDYIKNI